MALPAPLSPARGPENGEAPGRLGISLRGIRPFQPTKGQLPGCLCWSRAALAPLSQGSRAEHAHSDPALLEGTCWLGWSPPCLPSVAGAVGRMGAGSLPRAASPEPVERGQELVGAREAPSTSLTAPGSSPVPRSSKQPRGTPSPGTSAICILVHPKSSHPPPQSSPCHGEIWLQFLMQTQFKA